MEVINQKGFTLIELLTVILIIGILSSLAVPGYVRSVEKARATEAMDIIRAANAAVYAYAAERNKCPASFSKIMVDIPGTKNTEGTIVQGKYFRYEINAATDAKIPGTECGGVIAYRKAAAANGEISSGYKYMIWNPYKIPEEAGSSAKRALACAAYQNDPDSLGVCKSLGMYTELNAIAAQEEPEE